MAETKHDIDLYTLLGIDPDNGLDPAGVQRIMAEKEALWNKWRVGIGARADEAKRNLTLLAMLKPHAQTGPSLEAQADLARARKNKGRQDRISAFDRVLAIALDGGDLTEQQIQRWVDSYSDVLTAPELMARVKAAVDAHLPSEPPRIQRLEPSTVNGIRGKLLVVDKSSLYSFLGCPPDAPLPTLRKTADARRKQALEAGKKTDVVNAEKELAGQCLDIFSSEEKRNRYNATIKWEKLQPLLGIYADACAANQSMSTSQVERFLDDATNLQDTLHVTREEALSFLIEFADEHHFKVSLPSPRSSAPSPTPTRSRTPSPPAAVRCGNPACRATNDATLRFCKQCGEPLRIDCPNCGKHLPADQLACDGCGFKVGNRFEVKTLLAETTRQLDDKRIALARKTLRQARELWRTKTGSDPLTRQLDDLDRRCADAEKDEAKRQAEERERERQRKEERRKAEDDERRRKAEAERQRRELDALLDRIAAHVSARQFFAAQQFLTQHPECLADARGRDYQTRTRAAVQRVEQLLRQARQQTDIGERERLTREAIDTCADDKSALAFLRTLPPAPPRQMRASAGAQLVHLTWAESPSDDVQYVVVRKVGSPPLSPNDGDALPLANSNTCDDRSPVVGRPMYYVVFASRWSINSTEGATLEQPVMLTPDVSDLARRAGDSLVELTWTPPQNLARVVIVRKEDERPRAPHDGVQLIPSSPGTLTDRTVQNGHTYYYTLYCRYEGEAGRLHASPGVTVSATPDTPPTPVGPLTISGVRNIFGFQTRILAPNPDKGELRILKSLRAVPLHAGDVVPEATLLQYGRPIDTAPPATATDSWIESGVRYYVPVVVYQGQAYVGEPERHVWVEQLKDLAARQAATGLKLTWIWPIGCREVLVAYSHTDYPDQTSLERNGRTVTRMEYDQAGGYDVLGPHDQRYFIAIAPIYRYGDERIEGQAQHLRVYAGDRARVTYDVQPATRLLSLRGARLILRSDRPTFLPSLLLCARTGAPPTLPTEGEVVLRIEDRTHVESMHEFSIDHTPAPAQFFRLFLQHETDSDMIELVPPLYDPHPSG